MLTRNENAISRITVVHSSALFRSGLTTILGNMNGTRIAGAANLDKFVSDSQNSDTQSDENLDTILYSIDHFESQIGLLAEFQRNLPHVKILTLASDYQAEELFRLFEIGVCGALLDDVSKTTIELALRLISEGEKIYPSNLANVMMERFQYMSSIAMSDSTFENIELSQREQQILGCLASGDSNKRIAIRLSISEATVKVHVKSILRKIKVDNRTQAAIWALCSRSPK